jgi:hypothetical protein
MNQPAAGLSAPRLGDYGLRGEAGSADLRRQLQRCAEAGWIESAW